MKGVTDAGIGKHPSVGQNMSRAKCVENRSISLGKGRREEIRKSIGSGIRLPNLRFETNYLLNQHIGAGTNNGIPSFTS